jgi:Uma2 family endonuclease
MRPMSVREMDALCYERGLEFDPENLPGELLEMAQLTMAHPAWEGRSAAQELYERRAAERRARRRVPEWFSVQDLIAEPWERYPLERV